MNEKLVRNPLRYGLSHAVNFYTKAVAVNYGLIVTASRCVNRMQNMRNVSDLASVNNASKTDSVLFSVSREQVPLLLAYVANTRLSRLRGLFAFPPLQANNALVLQPCSAVHTIGFSYCIDIVFLDKDGIILKCVVMKPYSVCICWRAYTVVEMSIGTVQRLRLQPGQQLEIETNVKSYE